MITVLLYGFLGRQFGRVHHYAIGSPAEAVRALCATRRGFRKAIVDGGAYRVLVGGKDALSADRLPHPTSERETIRIVPVVAGAGRGFGQIIIGAALIIAAPYLGPVFGATAATATTAGVAGFAGITAGTFTAIGISLVLGGVSQFLFAPPKPQGPADRPENRPSFGFDGAVNTAAQGNPVSILYGKLIVGSQVISAGLSVEQI